MTTADPVSRPAAAWSLAERETSLVSRGSCVNRGVATTVEDEEKPALNLDPVFAPLVDALSSRFAIERELGRGGMGVVFLARDLRLDRRVALKALPPLLAADVELRERFLREARTAAGLAHPSIVAVHEADEAGGIAYFAMGYIDGESLGDRVCARGALPPVEAVPILRDTARALAYAHARGIVHRDVKPENVLLEHPSGRAMVTDFGIARAERDPSLTADGHLVGTAAYMSPEQCAGHAVDGRSDIYSLGVVAFFALSGQLPFSEGSTAGMLVAHVSRHPPPLSSVAPAVPSRLAAVIDRCLRKAPDERWASGEALADALDEALATAEREEQATPAGALRVLSDDQAALVWRRAAQLQADASVRLERDAEAAALRAATAELGGTQSYRLRDVEAAAVEAGISQRFVALAVAELPASLEPTFAKSGTESERAAAFFLGATARSVQASRTYRAPARRVLSTLGQCFRGAPWRLEFRSTGGPHPLAGGVLEFLIPSMNYTGQHALFWIRYGLYATKLRCSLRALGGDVTEVSVYVDPREGYSTNLWTWGASAGVGLSFGGAAGGVAIAIKGLALAGLAVGGVAAAGAGLGVVAAIGFARVGYRWNLRKAQAELEQLLDSLGGALSSADVFGDAGVFAPPEPRPALAGGNDAAGREG